MSWLASIFGSAAAAPIDAVGNILDKLFTSDEEKLTKKAIMQELALKPSLAQVELNKVAAQHRSIFVAGGRPFIMWVCGVSLALYFIPQYAIGSYLWLIMSLKAQHLMPYPVEPKGLFDLVLALLGLGLYRTAEKFGGRTK